MYRTMNTCTCRQGGESLRRHLIEQYGLGDKVISYSLGGMSYSQIADKLERGHGLKLTKASVCRWLAKHGETVTVVRKERTNEELALTIDGVKRLISEVFQEVERRLSEFESDPRALVAFLKLKLDVIDRMAKILGAYAPESMVAVGVVVDHARDSRCEICPFDEKGKTLAERIKVYAAHFQSLEDARICPHCGIAEGPPNVEETERRISEEDERQ